MPKLWKSLWKSLWKTMLQRHFKMQFASFFRENGSEVVTGVRYYKIYYKYSSRLAIKAQAVLASLKSQPACLAKFKSWWGSTWVGNYQMKTEVRK